MKKRMSQMIMLLYFLLTIIAQQVIQTPDHIKGYTPEWKGERFTDGRKLITKGFANLPLSAPGLGIELNEEVVKQHLHPTDKTYFEPTPQWNEKRSHDRIFS